MLSLSKHIPKGWEILHFVQNDSGGYGSLDCARDDEYGMSFRME
ncbi:hypothetical protein THIOSC15_150010 [uncultured Thiomicrorhabdus sp.]